MSTNGNPEQEPEKIIIYLLITRNVPCNISGDLDWLYRQADKIMQSVEGALPTDWKWVGRIATRSFSNHFGAGALNIHHIVQKIYLFDSTPPTQDFTLDN